MLARGIIIVNENSYYKDSLLQKWTLNFLLIDLCSADDPIGFQNVAIRLSKKLSSSRFKASFWKLIWAVYNNSTFPETGTRWQ